MPDSDIILWQGGVRSLTIRGENTTDLALDSTSQMPPPRFFLPSNVLVSRYGIVAMLVVDTRPKYRCVSYDDGNWVGVTYVHDKYDHGGITDPVRLAHFVGTEHGFSILRVLVLTPGIIEIFARDPYLGDPMIEKCACEKVFDVEFDEERAGPIFWPVTDATPLIEEVARTAWHSAGITTGTEIQGRQIKTWLSFHGWFVFSEAVAQAHQAQERALNNFDAFLHRVAPNLEPYPPVNLSGTLGALPDKS
jgi:hypothetical protein